MAQRARAHERWEGRGVGGSSPLPGADSESGMRRMGRPAVAVQGGRNERDSEPSDRDRRRDPGRPGGGFKFTMTCVQARAGGLVPNPQLDPKGKKPPLSLSGPSNHPVVILWVQVPA